MYKLCMDLDFSNVRFPVDSMWNYEDDDNKIVTMSDFSFTRQYCLICKDFTNDNVKEMCPRVKRVFAEFPNSNISFRKKVSERHITITVRPSVDKSQNVKPAKINTSAMFEEFKNEVHNMCRKCKNYREI